MSEPRSQPADESAWGDVTDLLRLLDVAPTAPGTYVGPPYRPGIRNVVEGGHLLGQAIVASSKELPDQVVEAAHMVFPRSAAFDRPVVVGLEVLRHGKTFSTVQARVSQDERLCATGLLLLGTRTPEDFRVSPPVPPVPAPHDCVAAAMGVSGRDVRIAGGAWNEDPDQTGPPEIMAWMRFRDRPQVLALHQAVIAQSASHWLGAAVMRPLPGVGLAQAHRTIMGGPLNLTITFHDTPDISGWLLYANVATYAGRGMTHGESRVFDASGRFVASFTSTGMMRKFPAGEDRSGATVDPSRRM